MTTKRRSSTRKLSFPGLLKCAYKARGEKNELDFLLFIVCICGALWMGIDI